MAELLELLKVLVRKRFPFRFVYSDEYWMVDIGPHVFPVKKYRMIHERLIAMGAGKDCFLSPEPATDEDILLVHSAKYLKKIKTGTLSSVEASALELPMSDHLYHFSLLSAGGTILTAREALRTGIGFHIGGGFHHAFADHGEGFCVLNDVAVAAAKLLKEGAVRKVMIVDCDLHQGNGTASIFSKREDVFTFSIHQMDIYPSVKSVSRLDVGLWSGDGDAEYLSAIREHFPQLYTEFKPDLVIYLAGADPYVKDVLGGLTLTIEGLRERDRIVIGEARKRKIPIAVVLAGGYSSEIEDTLAIHLNTIRVARIA